MKNMTHSGLKATFMQIAALDKLLQWAKAGYQSSAVSGVAEPEWSNIITVGHSRGSAVAFPQLAGNEVVKTAVLIAPVSTTTFEAPSKPFYLIGAQLILVLDKFSLSSLRAHISHNFQW
jgi:pimeloyl-ACP methyl ester carboxylesterase